MHELKDLIKQFMPFAQEKMGFNRPPKLFLRQDSENAANPLGKTGFYDPQAESITIYVSGRHPKDIMRSLSHELMHHTQKCNGDFDNEESQGMGEQGYAQNNIHMRTMEIQAYQASIVFRDWEDSLKETIYYEHLQKGANKPMSTKEWKNGEINTLLTEKWGFKFDLDQLNERIDDPEDNPTKRQQQGVEGLEEDFGEEEEEEGHYEDDAEHDEDHIEAIRHHLDALERDEGYDEGHEDLEEGGLADRPENKHRNKPGRGRRMDETRLSEEQVREVAQRVIRRVREIQKNG